MGKKANGNGDPPSSDEGRGELVPAHTEKRALELVDKDALKSSGLLAIPEARARFIQMVNSGPPALRMVSKETLYQLELDCRQGAKGQIRRADQVTGITRPLGPTIIGGAVVAAITATGGLAIFAAIIFAGAVVTGGGEYVAGKIQKRADDEGTDADMYHHISEQIREPDHDE
tara:strand:- start:13306 stop:13824 length:519 start_codon:yes stop_codon:yes gene_type:complete